MVETIEAPVETRTKTIPEILRHAALLIEEHGWRQDAYTDAQGRLCALGAMHLAVGDRADHEGAQDWFFQGTRATLDLLEEAADVLMIQVGRSVPAWNDDQCRTSDEVINALRCAADATDR